jgi:multidrug efflux pump subunit AcrB
LSWALRRPVAVLATALVFLGAGLALLPRIGISLVPELSQGELVVELEASPGTSLMRMEALARQAESILLNEFPEAREIFTNVGVRGGAGTWAGVASASGTPRPCWSGWRGSPKERMSWLGA